MKKAFLYFLGIALVGCAGSKLALTDADTANFNYAAAKFDGYTKQMYAQGKTISENSCNNCHKFKEPSAFTEEQLSKVVPKMADKAKLNATDKDLVLKYYLAGSKRD